MDVHDQLQHQLEKYTLSPEQARLYLCLAQDGALRIQELARRTGLARSSVYEHLKVLFRTGLAEEVVADSHKIIRPYPISVLRHGLQEKIQQLQQLENDMDDLEDAFAVFEAANSFPTMSVRYYKDVTGARQVLWNSLKAKSEVKVYSAWGRSLYVGKKFYENFVVESKRRGISEKVLINPRPDTLVLLKEHAGTALARTKIEDIRAIAEEKVNIIGETLIYDHVFAQVYLRGQEINGFEIENKHFTQSQLSIFATLWSISRPVESYL